MTFEERIILIRKQIGWSQADLAKKIGRCAPIVGRYEHEELKPLIDIASEIANVLDVSVDFLIGEGKLAQHENETIQRIEEIERLDPDTRMTLFRKVYAT